MNYDVFLYPSLCESGAASDEVEPKSALSVEVGIEMYHYRGQDVNIASKATNSVPLSFSKDPALLAWMKVAHPLIQNVTVILLPATLLTETSLTAIDVANGERHADLASGAGCALKYLEVLSLRCSETVISLGCHD
jgi:hypothetical protein